MRICNFCFVLALLKGMALLEGQRNGMILIFLRPYVFRLTARYLSTDLPSEVPNKEFMSIVSNLYRRSFAICFRRLNWDANLILTY